MDDHAFSFALISFLFRPSRMRQTAAGGLGSPPPACGTIAVAGAVANLATEDTMGSTSHPIVNLAAILLAATMALQAPALAQGKQDNPPQTPVPAPQSEPQSPPQAQDDHRFTFHRVENGFVRLDLRTGDLASCTPDGAGWSCVPGRDERAALDREIARLQHENATLKNVMLERGVPLPEGMTPTPSASDARWGGDEPVPRPPQTVPPTAAAPTPGTPPTAGTSQDDEIDRIMTAVEKGWRRFVEMVTDLQRDLQKKE
jgi:hypothetical protein